jgi:hypothetical protein
MKIREMLDLFENLGPLANLKAGDLLNVFKQDPGGRQSPDGSKFNPSRYDGIGQNSEQVDLGKITSWKDLRKAIGRTNEKKILGAVFYADGKAFASANLSRTNIYATSDTLVFAFDPAKLPAYEEPSTDGLDYRAAQEINNNRMPKPTAGVKEPSRWDNDQKVKKFTGRTINVANIEEYTDNVFAKFPEVTFTCTAITTDTKAVATGTERRKAKDRGGDELKNREDELNNKSYYNSNQHASRDRALDKFKASKNFNTFEDEAEAIDFIGDLSNIGTNFVYKGKQYQYSPRADETLTIKKSSIIKGAAFEFTVDLPATEKGSYNSLTVKYRFSNGKAVPIKVGR